MSRCHSLNVVQAAIQSLIDKLEPLFPEIAGMTVSSDGLIEAIHGCELRLVHAYEAVLVRPDHTDIFCINLLVAMPQIFLVAYSVCAGSCGMPACDIAMGTQGGVVCRHRADYQAHEVQDCACPSQSLLLLCWRVLHVMLCCTGLSCNLVATHKQCGAVLSATMVEQILQHAADKCHGHALPTECNLLLCRFPGLGKVHHRVTLDLLALMTQR